MSDIEVAPYYKRMANDMTNMLFDKNFLNQELSRDAIDKLEDYIGYVLQSTSQTAAKTAILTAKLKGE